MLALTACSVTLHRNPFKAPIGQSVGRAAKGARTWSIS